MSKIKQQNDKCLIQVFFHGKSHFEDDGTHNYLVFHPFYKHFKTVANGNKVTAWKS